MDQTELQKLVAEVAQLANVPSRNPVTVDQINRYLSQNPIIEALNEHANTLREKLMEKLMESQDEVLELTSKLRGISERQSRPNKYGQRRKPDWEKYCEHHEVFGHASTLKCEQVCHYCRESGHAIQFCYKLKNCVLCGKFGHNPGRCWKYWSIEMWMRRAQELGRCGECLTLFKADATDCANCHNSRSYLKKSQTGENSNKVQKCQKELQESKTIMKDLKNKILELEEELKGANTALSEVGKKWTNTLRTKNQELKRADKLDSLCRNGEVELKKLQEQIGEKDRERWAQPSQAAPAVVQQQYSAQIQQCPAQIQQHCPAATQQQCPVSTQQHCPASASNNLGHYNTPNLIKPTLMDLHDQQQKLCIMVNQLYDRIMTPNMSWLNYSSFIPNMGPYDTGQYCR